jgi:signal transduction histidine kinase
VEATSVSTDRADQVSDHGSGTDPARVDGGEGLVNMRRRASKLGGTLTVISRPGGGASVLLKAPLRCVVTVSSHSDLSLAIIIGSPGCSIFISQNHVQRYG